MNEYVTAAAIGHDKAEAFFVVEPFYGTTGHYSHLLENNFSSAANCPKFQDRSALKAALKT
jgi:hypothetical protein